MQQYSLNFHSRCIDQIMEGGKTDDNASQVRKTEDEKTLLANDDSEILPEENGPSVSCDPVNESEDIVSSDHDTQVYSLSQEIDSRAVIHADTLIDHASPIGSQVRPSSSRTSSIGPVTSPSQIVTQSQTDTYCSFSPTSNVDLESVHDMVPLEDIMGIKDTEESPSLPPPEPTQPPPADTVATGTSPGPLVLEMASLESVKDCSEVEENIMQKDGPSTHPIIFKG